MLILTGLVVLVCPALASAQLRFAQPRAELGEIRGGPVYQHRFDFVNADSEPLEITDIRLGCGCLQPVVEKPFLRPGEKSSVLMHIRTLGQPDGPRSWQAHVQYRQRGKLHETTLIIGATLRNEVTVEPSILGMTVGTTLRQEIVIKDRRALPLKIVRVVASVPAIRVTTAPGMAGVTKIALEVNGEALTAPHQEATLDIYTDDANYRHLQVPVTLKKAVRATVGAAPPRVEIVGTGSQLVRLRGQGDQTVRVETAKADHAAIRCTWAAGPGNDATLRIVVDASRIGDAANLGTVRVTLSEPAGGVVAIPVAVRKN